MSKEDLSKLYNPLEKLSSKPTAGENSTRLGLSIIKILVKLNHGEILCSSQVGVGTTFTVKLPLKEDEIGDIS